MPDLSPAEQYEKDVAEEWGAFVAIAPINYDGVRAYNVGDAVPVSNVKQHKYDEQGLVATTKSKAGKSAVTGEAS